MGMEVLPCMDSAATGMSWGEMWGGFFLCKKCFYTILWLSLSMFFCLGGTVGYNKIHVRETDDGAHRIKRPSLQGP